MKVWKIGTAILLLLCLCGCSWQAEKDFVSYNGRKLSESEMRALVKSEVEKNETSNMERVAVACETGELLTEESQKVYWTESGSVWHVSLSCGHLQGSTKVYYGTEKDAIAYKKQRVCATCGKQEQDP